MEQKRHTKWNINGIQNGTAIEYTWNRNEIQNITEIEMRNGTYMRIQIGTKFGIQARTGNRRAKWSIN